MAKSQEDGRVEFEAIFKAECRSMFVFIYSLIS